MPSRNVHAWVSGEMARTSRVSPDIIYARGVPADPSPDIDSFKRKDLFLILSEIGFRMDLGCHKKLKKKNREVQPLGNHSSSSILGTGRPCLHPHQPRQHNPQRHRVGHRDRASQSPPIYRQHEKTKRPQDAGNKQDRSPTRHADGGDLA